MVSLGIRTEGFQSHHPARPNVSFDLLGAHRIRVWPAFDPAERTMQHRHGHGGAGNYFCGDAGAIHLADASEETGG